MLLYFLLNLLQSLIKWEDKLPVILPVKMVDFRVLPLPKDYGILCIVEDSSLDIG